MKEEIVEDRIAGIKHQIAHLSNTRENATYPFAQRYFNQAIALLRQEYLTEQADQQRLQRIIG